MTVQRRTNALAFITRLDASRVARVMAAVRLGIGVIGLLAPGRLAWRLFVDGRRADEATVLVLRAAAGRDLALGLGTALASKRGPVPLRGWLLAAALVDCCDALAVARNKSASTGVRAVTALVGGLSAGTGMFLARQLSGLTPGPDGWLPDGSNSTAPESREDVLAQSGDEVSGL
jgi:hypothetical protein